MFTMMLLVAAAGLVLFIALVALMARARARARGVPPPIWPKVVRTNLDVIDDDPEWGHDSLEDDEFRALLLGEIAAGRKIEAIKRIRERTALGLKEARDAIELLSAGVAVPLSRRAPGVIADPLFGDDPDLGPQLAIHVGEGRKIEAIKLLRDRTGMCLKDAKDVIEALERDG